MSAMISGSLRRPLAVFAAILAITLASVAGMASAASAHNYVVSSTPTEGQTLTELPEEFIVTTNDVLLSAGAVAMEVTDADGLFYGDGCVTIDGASVSMPAALGAPGTYTLTWQAVSADAHTISGVISFVWAPTQLGEESVGHAAAPQCGVSSEEEQVEPSATAEEPSAPAVPEEESTLPVGIWIASGLIGLALIAVVIMAIRRKR